MASIGYQDHPLLPAKAPRGQAHILKDHDEAFSLEDLCESMDHELCDFIATFLFKLDMYPNALSDFFNPDVRSFKFIREGETTFLPFMIWRCGTQIICGFYETSNDERSIAWENVTRTQLSAVAPNATWTTKWGVWQARARAPLERLWEYGFVDVNQVNPYLFNDRNPYHQDDIKGNAFDFGKAIWDNQCWNEWPERKNVRFNVDAKWGKDTEPVPELELVF